MKWFYNLKIATKLIISFLVVALIAGVVGVVGLLNIMKITEADTLLYEENTLGVEYSSKAAIYYQRLRYNAIEMILLKDDSMIGDYTSKLNNFIAIIDESMDNYEEGIINPEDQKLFDELKPQWVKYRAYMQNAIGYANEGQYDKAQSELLGEADATGGAVQDSLAGLVDYNDRTAMERADNNSEMARTAQLLMVLIIFVGIILAVILGIFISRIISKPVKRIVEAADRLSVGDLDISFDTAYKDETGQLIKAFTDLVASTREQAVMAERIADGDMTVDVPIRSDKDLLGRKLSEMVQNINSLLLSIASAAEQVSGGSKQISDSSMALSQGATEQASSIEELTASIEEISSQTKVNAENASQANGLSDEAKTYAVTGNNQMKEMLRAMDDINESSSNINKIIKVIDDIAFQTNILALNAAVEAARAGQHGKGFAVVAEEVRTLAGRSANAAKETTALIEDSIKKSSGGTKIAKETADALEKIVDSVEAVSNLVSDINNASNEQAVAIAQINQGVMQVSQVVQENSATSEETAAASEELSSQAETLRDMVGRFKLKKSHTNSNSLSELNPDILKMLEQMSEKKKDEPKQTSTPKRTRKPKEAIVLSDNEFGKY